MCASILIVGYVSKKIPTRNFHTLSDTEKKKSYLEYDLIYFIINSNNNIHLNDYKKKKIINVLVFFFTYYFKITTNADTMIM